MRCSKNAYGENKYLYAVKINEGKPHQHGVRRPEGGVLMYIPLDINTDPNRKRLPCISSRKWLFHYPQQEKERFPPSNRSANERLAQLSQKSHYTLNSQFLQGTLCLLEPFQLPFPLYKGVFSIFVRDVHMACHGCRPRIKILCWSQIDPFLLGK